MTETRIDLPPELTDLIMDVSYRLADLYKEVLGINPTAGWSGDDWRSETIGFIWSFPATAVNLLRKLITMVNDAEVDGPWKTTVVDRCGSLIPLLEGIIDTVDIMSASPTRPELHRARGKWEQVVRDLHEALTGFGQDVTSVAQNQGPPWPPPFGAGKHTEAKKPPGYPGPKFGMEVVAQVMKPVNPLTVALLGIEVPVQKLVFSRETAPDDEFPFYFQLTTPRREYHVEVYQDYLVVTAWKDGDLYMAWWIVTERELREQVVIMLADHLAIPSAITS